MPAKHAGLTAYALGVFAALWSTAAVSAQDPFQFHGAGAVYRAAPLDPAAPASSPLKISSYELTTTVTRHVAVDLCAFHIVETLAAPNDAAPIASLRTVYRTVQPQRWTLLSWSSSVKSGPDDIATAHHSELLRHDAHLGTQRSLDPLTFAQRGSLSAAAETLSPQDASLLRSYLPPPSSTIDSVETAIWPIKLAGASVHRFFLARADEQGACPAVPKRTHAVYSTRGDTNSGPQGTEAVDVPAHEERLIDFAASRTVRIEFVNGDGSAKMDFCSGVLLSPTVVLTAGHCLDRCGRDCASYTVDADLRFAPPDSLLSVPARSAENYRSTGADYGLLYLNVSAPLKRAWENHKVAEASSQWVVQPDQGRLWIRNGEQYSPIKQQLLAHPSGRPMLLATCDLHTHSDEALAHTCYSGQGSSGGVLWLNHGKYISILALHRRYVRECATGHQEKADWSEPMEQLVTNAKLRVSRTCLGQAVPIKTLWLKLCRSQEPFNDKESNAKEREEACKELEAAQLLRSPAI